MNKIHPVKRTLILGLLLLVAIGCALPLSARSTPTATAALISTLPPVNSSGGAQGSAAGGNSSSAGAGNNSSSPANAGEPNPASDSATATPTPLPELHVGPYDVKQIETLGHESISGMVCTVAKPFIVVVTTPRNVFTFNFVPLDDSHGNINYAYNLPSAGESHSANGTYQVSKADHDGTRHLTMSVSDHVVFKGFDGNIPNRYKFDLVPSSATCP